MKFYFRCFFFLLRQSINLDSSNESDLEFWDCLGRNKKNIFNKRNTVILFLFSGGEIFSHSYMSNFPKLHLHPSGEYIGFIGLGVVTVETVLHEPVYEKQRDFRNSNYKYFAFSPNGKYAAILLNASRRFELLLSRLSKGFPDKSVDLLHVYKGFKGSDAYNEHLECKWSPDSSNIAVCTSIGFLVVLDTDLKSVVNVFEDILKSDTFPSCAGAFDYDPRSCHQVLAFGTNDRRLFIVNTESRNVLYESDTLGPDPIDCVQYSPSGNLLGLSLRNWSLLFIETRNLEIVFKLNTTDCPAITATNISNGFSAFPSIMRLSFSSTEEQIATSSCDGFVRVWQLPSFCISLKGLCRQAILSFVPTSKLQNLSLPKRLLDEMLAMPVMG